MATDLRVLILSLVYAVVGMILLYLGYRIFDWLTPEDMQAKIFKEGNTAVAVMAAAFILGLSIVIAAAIHG
jgi:putative membrane protein